MQIDRFETNQQDDNQIAGSVNQIMSNNNHQNHNNNNGVNNSNRSLGRASSGLILRGGDGRFNDFANQSLLFNQQQ